MKETLIAFPLFAFIGLVLWALYGSFKHANQAKREAWANADYTRTVHGNMLLAAGLLSKFIAAADTYEKLCKAEDFLKDFKETYGECEEFKAVKSNLLKLMEQAREAVREKDKAEPFDYRYNVEG